MQNAVSLIKRLQKKGYTKYQIKQFCSVEWPTVHKWSKGFSVPESKNLRLLNRMLKLDRTKVLTTILELKELEKNG